MTTCLEVTIRHRPWWGLGILAREEQFVMYPPEGATLAELRLWRQRFLDAADSRTEISVREVEED